ncbi:hypothetical protein N8I74_17935 [Chitiniphilus purpureus]|uniref:Surface-adhesin protein E-like domain-containing protein n=1 Tax=Chitiniphilus purpureus TaxID=2981137 RepID=A0ABY6DLE6_9NEIS|nr:surface-adhesin E family protein [Chitiniphilus sp. CD1]UXY15169.1 hypothetical protein N8I74_17935 [Chitiniphilus sp. CD1]
MKAALVLSCLTALTACGKFEDDVRGPVPVPYKGEWRNYGQMPDFDIWVDVASITHNDRHASDRYTYVWMRQDFKADQVDGPTKEVYRIKYARVAIDCPSGRLAKIAAELRDADDAKVARYDVPGYQWEFETPQPNSYGADFVRQVCKIMAGKDAAADDE